VRPFWSLVCRGSLAFGAPKVRTLVVWNNECDGLLFDVTWRLRRSAALRCAWECATDSPQLLGTLVGNIGCGFIALSKHLFCTYRCRVGVEYLGVEYLIVCTISSDRNYWIWIMSLIDLSTVPAVCEHVAYE
jgi:hypothetical protein